MTGNEKKKLLAVIILNWNGKALLERFIPKAVEFTTGDAVDLIIADNGSTDDSVEWLNQNYPQVKLLTFSKNYGFADGYNRAIKETDYPYTILLNSDVEVTENWWQPLLEFMKMNEKAGAAQPKIKSYHKRDYFEYAGAAGGYLDRYGYPYCRGRLFDRIAKDKGQYDGQPVNIAWASGAAMIVRTELYLRLGGLDPKFFAHMEEIDLCCRMQAAGYSIYCVPDSEVFHVGGGSLPKDNPKKTYLNFRNNLLLLYKNYSKKKGRRKLFLRRLIDTLAVIMFGMKLDLKNVNAVIKAHNDFRRMKKEYRPHEGSDFMQDLPGYERYALIDRYLINKRM